MPSTNKEKLMNVVKIKMLRDFTDDHSTILLHKGNEYYAIDGGDYWIVQRWSDGMFIRVVPKHLQSPVIPEVYAEEVE